MKRLNWLLCVLGLGLAACGSSGGDKEDEDVCAASGIDFAAATATENNGRQVYADFCASCHGADGKGQTDATAPKSNRGGTIRDELDLSDDCFAARIKNGFDDMPPISGITDAQIADLVAWMKDSTTASGGSGW